MSRVIGAAILALALVACGADTPTGDYVGWFVTRDGVPVEGPYTRAECETHRTDYPGAYCVWRD